MTPQEKLAARLELVAKRLDPDGPSVRDTPGLAPVGVAERVRGIIALLRQPEPDNGEKRTEHDEGYEQASSEIADMLEAALATPAVEGGLQSGHAATLRTMIHQRKDGEPCICAECRAIAYAIRRLTTPPPAPAATYATPDDVGLTMGPDDIPRLLIAGAEVASFPKGSWAEVCEAFDFGGYRYESPAPAAEQARPEARGVEAPADDCTATEWLDFANGNSVQDIAAALATPNPVQAEQPEGRGADRMAIRLLVAAGHVTEAKANEALNIAHGFSKEPLSPPSAPVGGKLLRDLRMIAEQGEMPDGDGVPVNVRLWAEKHVAALSGVSAPVGVDESDVRWLLDEVRHGPLDHDYIKDEKRCVRCKSLAKITAALAGKDGAK